MTSSWSVSAHVKQVIFWVHSHHNIKPHTANDILVAGATSKHLKTMSPLGLTSPWHMSKIFSVSLRMLRAICSRASTRDLRSDPTSMWHRKNWRQTWPSACREYIEYIVVNNLYIHSKSLRALVSLPCEANVRRLGSALHGCNRVLPILSRCKDRFAEEQMPVTKVVIW